MVLEYIQKLKRIKIILNENANYTLAMQDEYEKIILILNQKIQDIEESINKSCASYFSSIFSGLFQNNRLRLFQQQSLIKNDLQTMIKSVNLYEQNVCIPMDTLQKLDLAETDLIKYINLFFQTDDGDPISSNTPFNSFRPKTPSDLDILDKKYKSICESRDDPNTKYHKIVLTINKLMQIILINMIALKLNTDFVFEVYSKFCLINGLYEDFPRSNDVSCTGGGV